MDKLDKLIFLIGPESAHYFCLKTNSIEEFFSQLKHYIKKESPNTYEDIDKVIKDILKNKIQNEHLTNYLKHSYRIYT